MRKGTPIRRWTRRAGKTLGASAGATLVMAGLASASWANVPLVKTTSQAGYTATDPNAITSFTGSMNVPTLTCPASGNINIFNEVDISGGGVFVEMGTQLFCSGGTADYNAGTAQFDGSLSAASFVSISPGDSLKFSMTYAPASGLLTAKVTDNTKKTTGVVSGHTGVVLQSVVAVTNITGSTGGGTSPIPSWTPSQHFNTLKFNGALLSSLSSLTKEQMYDGTTLQVAATAISAAGSFSTVFKHV